MAMEEGQQEESFVIQEQNIPVHNLGACISPADCIGLPSTERAFALQIRVVDKIASSLGKELAVESYYGHRQVVDTLFIKSGFKWHNIYLDELTMNSISTQKLQVDNVFFDGRFHRVKFIKSNIKNTTFNGVMYGVIFYKARLNNVLFDNVTIINRLRYYHAFDDIRSSFEDAQLENVYFRKTNLKHVTFKNAWLINVYIDASTVDNLSAFENASVLVYNNFKIMKGELWKKMAEKWQIIHRSHDGDNSHLINLGDLMAETLNEMRVHILAQPQDFSALMVNTMFNTR